jgi:hypothetical protein
VTPILLRNVLHLLRPRLEAAGFSLTDGFEIEAGDAGSDHFEFRAGAGRGTCIIGVYGGADGGEITAELWWPAELGAYVDGSRTPRRQTWPASGENLPREIADQILAWVAAAP